MRTPESGARGWAEWDEDTWERFLKREDTRTAKFEELLETLGDQPDRNQVIMDELKLRTPFGGKCPHEDCAKCSSKDDCEVHEMRLIFEWPEDDSLDSELDEIATIFEEVERIPAYQQAHKFSLMLQAYFSMPRDGGRAGMTPMRRDEIWTLLDTAALVAAQVAGGHGIGYEPDCICGNIANCKRALRNAAGCLRYVRDMGLPETDAIALTNSAGRVCAAISGWIEELRSRVA